MNTRLVYAAVTLAVFFTAYFSYTQYSFYHFESKVGSDEKPTLTVKTVYPSVETIDVSVEMSQAGEFGCVAVTAGGNVPDVSEIKLSASVEANVPGYILIAGLESEITYDIYCFGKSKYGIDMSTTIADTKQTTTTKGRNDAPVVIVGRVDVTDTEATITALSTLPGKLYCIVTPSSIAPTRLEIKEKSSSVPIAVYEYTQSVVSGLTASTDYYAYCNVETNAGVPMLSDVGDVGQQFKTADAPESAFMFTLRILATVFCICMSGIFSGLNLGLMGLDLISLQMISETDVDEIAGENADPEEVKRIKIDKERATKILPIRRKGNLLLCTLLIGNVMVNSIISILTADMTSGTIGFIISTCLITAFGEVIPQAYGSRHGLKLGAYSTGLVKVIIGVLYIICKPVSAILDYCLGEELGNIYNRYQLYTMFELYKERSDFKKDTIKTMQGALVMDTKTVHEYMQPLDKVFMLPDTAVLDHNTCLEIFRKGFSRIPIYHENRQNIRGILHVKELIMLDPNQCVNVETLLKLFPSSVLVLNGRRTVSESIKDMVNSHTELAFISKVIESNTADNRVEIVGAVTMEDMIKAVMRLDLVDETPLIENEQANEVSSIFSQIILNHLDPTTVDIITYFINQSLAKQDLYLPSDVIHSLIQKASIEKIAVGDKPIYEVNKFADYAVVILQGVFTMYIGEDRMVTEKPVFSVINISSIFEDNFVSPVSLELHERPIVDVLTNEVTGFNSEGFIIKIPKSIANELNIKSRIVPLRKGSSAKETMTGESEHSVMLPLEIEENTDYKQ